MRQIIEFLVNVGIYTANALKSVSSAIISAYYALIGAVQWLMLNITKIIDWWLGVFR